MGFNRDWTHPLPQPWFRDRTGGTGRLAPQTSWSTAGTSIPDSGLGRVPQVPQVPLPTLLPFSLLPSPQPPLPGQCSQEAQETEEEEQSLDSRFPDGYQDRLCRAR